MTYNKQGYAIDIKKRSLSTFSTLSLRLAVRSNARWVHQTTPGVKRNFVTKKVTFYKKLTEANKIRGQIIAPPVSHLLSKKYTRYSLGVYLNMANNMPNI